jgi:hypothetical protein
LGSCHFFLPSMEGTDSFSSDCCRLVCFFILPPV